MEFTAAQLSELLEGRIEGDANATVSKLSKIEEGEPNSISFLANEAYTPFLYSTDASVVIIGNDLVLEKPVKKTCTLIRVSNPRKGFMKLLETYNKIKNDKTGIEQPVSIADTALIGENAYIGAFTYIGQNVKIGDNVKIYPNTFIGDNVTIGNNSLFFAGVKIYSDCIVGNNCIIQAGVSIGGDGFGFVPNSANNYEKMAHTGNVIIENNVEIGANCAIDRATLGSTIIRNGVKLDNLIQVAHNVEIGENTVVAAQAGFAGSSTIGKDCMIGGQVGVIGHISLANGIKVAAQSGVGSNVNDIDEIVQGSPAFNHSDYKRSYVLFKQLPSLSNTLSALKKEVEELKNGSLK